MLRMLEYYLTRSQTFNRLIVELWITVLCLQASGRIRKSEIFLTTFLPNPWPYQNSLGTPYVSSLHVSPSLRK